MPACIRERPTQAMEACCQRISLARGLQVTESDDGARKVSGYEVNLGTANSMPTCECHSWRHGCFPCKHMFALLSYEGWDECMCGLSSLYLNNPYISLDPDIVKTSRTMCTRANTQSREVTSQTNTSSQQGVSQSSDISSRRQQSSANPGKRCRQLLSAISGVTYQLPINHPYFEDMERMLADILDNCQSHAPREVHTGLPISAGVPAVKKGTKRKLSSYDTVPSKKRRRHKYTGRVGARAEMMRKHTQVNVIV